MQSPLAMCRHEIGGVRSLDSACCERRSQKGGHDSWDTSVSGSMISIQQVVFAGGRPCLCRVGWFSYFSYLLEGRGLSKSAKKPQRHGLLANIGDSQQARSEAR